jgi:hypothetical protein
MILKDFDADCIECDGSFPVHDGETVGTSEEQTVIIEKQIGRGRIVVTSIHEFPSRRFLLEFCRSATQTVF